MVQLNRMRFNPLIFRTRSRTKLLSVVLVLLTLWSFLGCEILFDSDGNRSGGGLPGIGTVSQFWAQDLTDNIWYQLDAVLLEVGRYSMVYVEKEYADSVNGPAIAREFDNKIYPIITDKFGPVSDVDGTGRITILILDIRDGFTGSPGGYVAGYFDARQLFISDNSNRRDMIYMDLDPAVPGSEDFYITIAHELQHLINFNTTFLRGNGQIQETWINEGLSAAAEYLYNSGHIDWKITYYNTDPSGDIGAGYKFLYWENELANYSTVYLFFQWLRIHSSNGSGIYREILDSPHVDYRAVTGAANTRIGTDDWRVLLQDWLAANKINAPSGRYGYAGELTLTTELKSNTEDDIGYLLYPGEAIYVKNSGEYNVPTETSPISYFGLESDVIRIGPMITDGTVVVYNTGTNPKGSGALSGPLPTSGSVTASTKPSDSIVSVSGALPQIYPIGVLIGPDGAVTGVPRANEREAPSRAVR